MYQGRHCTISDYQLYEKTSQDFLNIINRDNFNIDELDNYLNIFSDFDFSLASKIRTYLEKMDSDRTVTIIKITKLLEELKSNVLVDLREHN